MEFLREQTVVGEDNAPGCFSEADGAFEQRGTVAVRHGFGTFEWRKIERFEIRKTPTFVGARRHGQLTELLPRRLLALVEPSGMIAEIRACLGD